VSYICSAAETAIDPQCDAGTAQQHSPTQHRLLLHPRHTIRRGAVPDIDIEAPTVAALRSLGAVLVGKTQMQEYGLLPTGISSKLGLARNPYDPNCIIGGSRWVDGWMTCGGVAWGLHLHAVVGPLLVQHETKPSG